MGVEIKKLQMLYSYLGKNQLKDGYKKNHNFEPWLFDIMPYKITKAVLQQQQ